MVKQGTWFGSYLLNASKLEQAQPYRQKEQYPFALVGCTVTPEFHYEDFELLKNGAHHQEIAAIIPHRLKFMIDK